jgi:exopolyphosphatase/guanosine-5'-triphosphate,3'-diphosphate pyrophosphatase
VVRALPGGRVEQLEHGAIGTRLGEGLRDAGPLHPAGRARTLDAVRLFAERVRAHGARPFAIATSAMRRASDAADFAAEVAAAVGAPLEVLDGAEEAACSFAGATAGAPRDGARRAVLDIGGGSTECATGRDGVLENARSIEIGSVRLTERYPNLAGGAPGEPARRAATAAREMLRTDLAWLRGFAPVAEVRAVAGTPLTLAAVAFGSSVDLVSGRALALAEIDALLLRMLDLDLDGRKALPGMLAQRADVLAGGGLILSEALRALGVTETRLESDDLLLGFLLRHVG